MSARRPTARAARIGAAAHDRDDARLADAGVMLDAERGEPLADDLRGAVLLEAELRMHVEVAAHRREFGVPGR